MAITVHFRLSMAINRKKGGAAFMKRLALRLRLALKQLAVLSDHFGFRIHPTASNASRRAWPKFMKGIGVLFENPQKSSEILRHPQKSGKTMGNSEHRFFHQESATVGGIDLQKSMDGMTNQWHVPIFSVACVGER